VSDARAQIVLDGAVIARACVNIALIK